MGYANALPTITIGCEVNMCWKLEQKCNYNNQNYVLLNKFYAQSMKIISTSVC